MVNISFSNFRGFNSQSPIPVRPITILIGENSAGKSSFMAGLKYTLDFVANERQPNFNGDPFQLGTFAQIAHYRGGRGGRAREFKIAIETDVIPNLNRTPRSRKKSDRSSKRVPVKLELVFSNIDSQAGISSVLIQSGKKNILASITSKGIQSEYSGSSGRIQLEDHEFAPRFILTDIFHYWPFFLRNFSYRMELKSQSSETETEPHEKEALENISKLSALALALSKELNGDNHATSAIRMKPQRVYSPGTEAWDGEGSHVPFEIAKSYRARNKNKRDWLDLKSSIEKFGAASGMFKKLSVKSFGNSSSDPFQIQFSSEGPKTNLVDLGYGTSQILPILHNIAVSKANSRFLVQQPEVHLHPKAQAALGQYFIDAFVSGRKNFVLETHSDFIVDRIRNAIAEKIIAKEDVSILFFRRQKLENSIVEIKLDNLGEPISPPNDYRSFFIGEQMKLLGI